VIVADGVGLGKTFIAGELIYEATVTRRQKVLVITPATLRDSTWGPFLRLPRHWNIKRKYDKEPEWRHNRAELTTGSSQTKLVHA